MARTVKSTDEILAALKAELSGSTTVEKTAEEKQREEASAHVREVFASAHAGLEVEKFSGEAKDLIAKAAANIHSALRNATAAVKKQADPSNLPGVTTASDPIAVDGTNAAE